MATKDFDRQEHLLDRGFVYVAPDGKPLVYWEPNNRFCIKDLTGYNILMSDGGEFTKINTAPVTDTMYLDESSKTCSSPAMKNRFYVVQAVALDGKTYNSAPIHVLSALESCDYRIASQVVRKEWVHLRKSAGTKGYLLKRRHSGTPCSTCLDADTGNASNTSCRECYGTGFQLGYYNAVPTLIALGVNKKQYDHRAADGQGVVSHGEDVSGRAVPFPPIAKYDLFVTKNTNRRYIVKNVAEIASMKTVPLVYSLSLQEQQVSSHFFSIPLEQDLKLLYGPTHTKEDVFVEGPSHVDRFHEQKKLLM